jgi:hypothetical protein
VDIIEVRDGKIQNLRAYAGWRAMRQSPAELRRRLSENASEGDAD